MIYSLLILGFLYFGWAYPSTLNAQEETSYNILLMAYFLISAHIAILNLKNRIDLFEPISMVIFISLFLFVVSPMILLINKDTSINDVYMFSGSAKATLLYILSYFAFALAYFKNGYEKQTSSKSQTTIYKTNYYNTNRVLFFSYSGWVVCFLLSLVYNIFVKGFSLAYILSFSLVENSESTITDTPLKFLINFGFSLIPFWLYIMLYSKNKFIKIVTTVLTTVIYFMAGTRFIFIILFGSLYILKSIIKNKRPSFKFILSSLSVVVIFFSIIGFIRNSVRDGIGFSLSSFDIREQLYEAFYTNANIVMPFYTIVDKIPSVFPHTWGNGYFLEPLYYFLPRFLYPNKPGAETADIVVAMNNATGFEIAQRWGMATPSFSELYIQFGYFGCIIGMFLFGNLLRKIKKLYVKNNASIHDLIYYVIIFTTLFQFLIRGYMAMNVFLILFLLLPVSLVKAFSRKYN